LPTPSVKVEPVETEIVGAPPEFVFLMRVKNYVPQPEGVSFEGALQSGTSISRSAQRFYLLDENFKLLDSVKVKSVSGLFGQFSVQVENFVEPEKVAYIAETRNLRDLNSLGQDAFDKSVNNVPLVVITNNDGASKSQNREVITNVMRDKLNKSDDLYVYSKSLQLVNAAEIIYLIGPNRNSMEAIDPTENVELVLEFAREFSGEEVYLTTLRDIEPLKDYIMILNL
jgi:hypothetical protein